MPKMDGIEILPQNQEISNTPIIMLSTAKEEDIDKITSLTTGADDEYDQTVWTLL